MFGRTAKPSIRHQPIDCRTVKCRGIFNVAQVTGIGQYAYRGITDFCSHLVVHGYRGEGVLRTHNKMHRRADSRDIAQGHLRHCGFQRLDVRLFMQCGNTLN